MIVYDQYSPTLYLHKSALYNILYVLNHCLLVSQS